jgi:hypothetical protein
MEEPVILNIMQVNKTAATVLLTLAGIVLIRAAPPPAFRHCILPDYFTEINI